MEKDGEWMMHRKCRMHNQAVAGVIEALLMVSLQLNVIDMQVQIAPGWIK
jgi:hypothetical protein